MKVIGAVAAVLMATAFGPAHAACKDEISKLEAQSNAKTKSSIAGASGGQGTAARREAPPAEQGTGDQAMQAKVALNDAKVALSKGDEAACESAITKASGKLGGK